MSACETCWTEASRRARHTAEIYRRVLAENEGWPPHDMPCGGISVNGSEWKWCEVHMLPRGHKANHPHTREDA